MIDLVSANNPRAAKMSLTSGLEPSSDAFVVPEAWRLPTSSSRLEHRQA